MIPSGDDLEELVQPMTYGDPIMYWNITIFNDQEIGPIASANLNMSTFKLKLSCVCFRVSVYQTTKNYMVS